MKKFFFFPVWKAEKIEQKLSCLEQEGWRLTKGAAPFLFCFTQSKPKETQYFLTYSDTKELGMWNIEHYLKSKLNADELKNFSFGLMTTVNVYRITQSTNLEKPRFYRNIYLQHYVLMRILLFLVLPVITALCGILQKTLGAFSTQQVAEWAFLVILSIVSLFVCGWYVYGFLFLKQQYKQMREHISIVYEDLQC